MCFDEPEIMREELKLFKESGGGAIVDVTCHGWGRAPEMLKNLSFETGVHIVACTGFYIEDFMPDWIPEKTVEELADWVVREIEIGCNRRLSNEFTDVKAGVIKTSVSRPYFHRYELKGLEAVALAHLRTGVPITSHNSGSIRFELNGGNIGLELLDYLESMGVDLESVIVGHCDENADLRNLITLTRRGAYIQFDTIGKQQYLLDETRADLVVKLIDGGAIERILLSQDRNRKPMLKTYGGPGYSDIIDRFIPMLIERGVTKSQIHQLFVKNPAMAFRRRKKEEE
jgi:phosphotriesterase-related protein